MAIANARLKSTVESVTITLNREEFEALAVALCNVGGHSLKSPLTSLNEKSARGSLDAIHEALVRAGCPRGTELSKENPRRFAVTSALMFKYPVYNGNTGNYEVE